MVEELVLLALLLILAARPLSLCYVTSSEIALACSFLFSWFAFPVYYGLRFHGSERIRERPFSNDN
jgi:hypothetical protein